MSAIENYNFPAFFAAAKELRAAGHEVISPAEEDLKKGWVRAEYRYIDGKWEECSLANPWDCCEASMHRYVTTPEFDYEKALKFDLKLIEKCDGIALLPDWQISTGALRERAYADDLELYCYELDNDSDRGVLGLSTNYPQDALTDLTPSRRPAGWRVPPRVATGNVEEVKTIYENRTEPLRTPEQHEVLSIFYDMLAGPTGDGGKKRAAGEKPSWKVDTSHEAAMWSHISKWKHGEKVDADSGAHPLVHLAWRALAIAWQETYGDG
jgi:hypothetical protein